MIPPAYFEQIRRKAADRWDQLERDPDLAAPWHQLFKQVQSPRHILSELLQNADDAGATEASVRIEDGAFVFEHDGEDFREDHFASLCRFGYSNKRVLHTIGFRGIGFKSTFSLGDNVELTTPTLSVVFNRRRFTEPQWRDNVHLPSHLTQVRVAIADDNRRREVEKNLDEWLKSPVSLLFFKNIRRLRIGDHDLKWNTAGKGPLSNSEWLALNGQEEQPYLLVRSQLEAFPEECVAEIAQERMLDGTESADFPPCKVELLLGAKGRLYVVLPTGVETVLPFACNATFIQDPARLKIKDPEISPTNRWLLNRIGKLAASALLEWLGNSELALKVRSDAYRVMPDVDRSDNSLEGVCATIAELAFADATAEKSFILTQSGKLVEKGMSSIIPHQLFDIWPESEVSRYFDPHARPPLSRHISEADRTKLLNWKAVENIDRERILTVLQSSRLPKPETWKQLLTLWEFVTPGMIGFYRDNPVAKQLCIVPVHSKDLLYSANEVVRLGEKRLLQSDEDWEMLSSNLLVLNQNWPRFITEYGRIAETDGDDASKARADLAAKLFRAIGLEESSDASKVVEQVAAAFFKSREILIENCVRLAQIACKLGASIGSTFLFVTRDATLRSIENVIVYDPKGELESLLPEDWCISHTLHEAYSNSWNSCSSDEWQQWIESGRSGFARFTPILSCKGLFRRSGGSVYDTAYGREKIVEEMEKRGFSGTPEYRFRNNYFQIEDWNFAEELWKHWQTLAQESEGLWGQLMQKIIEQPPEFWSKAKNARAIQIATTGSRASITNDPLLPSWIMKFRDLPCLPDTRGFYRIPSELLRRTPETEALLDVELFVHGSIDNESIRPLLDLLGVGTIPTGPDRLLDRLRALSRAERPPVHEVEKWYMRLDQMAVACSTEDFSKIKHALLNEKIVLTESLHWIEGSTVYLSVAEDDVPGAAMVRRSVIDLTLWRKIGIPERPTADMAIQWLNSLPRNFALPPEDLVRVTALLHRHAPKIWHECNCWLNLADELVGIESLSYSLSLRTFTQWDHLFKSVIQKTADFRQLPTDLADEPPFSLLPALASRIEDRFVNLPVFQVHDEQKPWLKRLGQELTRIALDNDDEQTRIRTLGAKLAISRWLEVKELEVTPYLDGTPAGTAREADVIWSNEVIYVSSMPAARQACIVPDLLGKVLGRADIASALNYCFGRSPDEVTEYMEMNFLLLEQRAAALEPKHEKPESDPMQPDITMPIAAPDVIEHDDETGREEIAVVPPESEDAMQPVNLPPGETRKIVEPARPHHPPTPPKPGFIERFITAMGYRKAGENYFINGTDGTSFSRSNEGSFNLIRTDAQGNIIYHYWVKEKCIDSEPLQMDVDVWRMVDKYPETHGFLLSNQAGNPVEIQGTELKAMLENGNLKIYPATYRLSIES